METIKFCKDCDTVIFIDDSVDMKLCPKCGKAFINTNYKIPKLKEDEEKKE